MKLGYDQPATRWTEALPLGNGRLGAMAFGGTSQSRYQINDDTCWTGNAGTAHGRLDELGSTGPSHLAKVRDALERGDIKGATEGEYRLQMGWSQAYQPLADVWLESDEPAAGTYRRWLDLDTATCVIEWTAGGRRQQERSWVSAPDGALIIERLVLDGPGIDGGVVLTSPHAGAQCELAHQTGSLNVRLPSSIGREQNTQRVIYDPAPGASVTAAVVVQLNHDGRPERGLTFTAARRILLVVTSATDFAGAREVLHGEAARMLADAETRAQTAATLGSAELHRRHVADYTALSDRMRLDLGVNTDEVDVNSLLSKTSNDCDSRALATVIFAYGRYLTIAASRPGSRAMNLQGIWNENLLPPWRSNYTTNINLQMNYWPTEAIGLPECHEPLLDWLGELASSGARTARELYGMPGWTAHHNSDIWGFSVPAGDGDFDPVWSMWPLAGAWLCRHLWERWEYSQDDRELRDRSWPILRGAAEFALHWIVENQDGTVGTSPSTSPENHFMLNDGTSSGLTTSTTSDLAMLRDLFASVVQCSAVLGISDDVTEAAQAALDRIPTERITATGRLAEWSEDLSDADPKHRHQSHLYGVMPGEGVLAWRDFELAAAALRSLDDRGDRTTGWSLAWRTLLRARLRDVNAAHEALLAFLAPVPDPDNPGPSGTAGLYANLFCAHPPFQIDGNFGITAAILEMIVQSHGGRIALLPALPRSWGTGHVRGVRLRGGVSLDLEWENGIVRCGTLHSSPGASFVVEVGNETLRIEIPQTGHASIPVSKHPVIRPF
ncbi:glycoside hydrolase family 95 protein [Pseudarthrobacter sp. efr-133-R2A-89]|uniref:glycoside hydrolase family 95 protein n=1 Tax=Pseudarthrobacter sp. efr-133-R2A-89 TaxID=3040302 RepID=UPI002552C06D|nr:glycoside hydrolase family 95 protein [Pseudarthrobacter sp. efr-133-R2A-89]